MVFAANRYGIFSAQCSLLTMPIDAERVPPNREWFVLLLGSWRASLSLEPRRSARDWVLLVSVQSWFGHHRGGQGGL